MDWPEIFVTSSFGAWMSVSCTLTSPETLSTRVHQETFVFAISIASHGGNFSDASKLPEAARPASISAPANLNVAFAVLGHALDADTMPTAVNSVCARRTHFVCTCRPRSEYSARAEASSDGFGRKSAFMANAPALPHGVCARFTFKSMCALVGVHCVSEGASVISSCTLSARPHFVTGSAAFSFTAA